jgi:hypothetical protein
VESKRPLEAQESWVKICANRMEEEIESIIKKIAKRVVGEGKQVYAAQ